MTSDKIIDMPTFEALEESMGADFITELVQAYLQETPQLITALQQAFTAGDRDSFRRAAHSIKSTSNSFGALEFGSLARELEMIGKDGQLDSAKGKLEQLVNGFSDVKLSLEQACHAE
jgi:HPt (histidine-containing phosphotransfer) domain-containing protein